MGGEAHHGSEFAAGRAREHEQVIGSELGLERAHPHRESEQTSPPRSPSALECLDLGLELRSEVASLAHRHLPATPGDTVDRLAQLADATALERETSGIHEALLTGLHDTQAQLAVGIEITRRRTPHRDLPTPRPRDGEKAGQHQRRRANRGDRIA